MPFLAPIAAAAVTAAGALGASTAVAAGVGGFTTLLAAGGLAFAGIKTLGALTAKPDTPSAPAALPSAAPSFEQVQKDEQKKNLELARRKRAGTTLTSPQGLLSTEESSKKTLLGG